MSVLKRTKIVATLGPASENEEILIAMLNAGMNVVRVNFSHGKAEDHSRRISLVRKCAKATNKEVGILADLQGPKIRIARFASGSIRLSPGDKFSLDAAYPSDAGTQECVGIDYKELPNDLKAEDVLLLDDGRLVLKVDEVQGSRISCTVIVGGALSNNKGINRLGGGLSAKALTEKDKRDLEVAADLQVDYVAISFPRSAANVLEAKNLLQQVNSDAGVIAKIERAEAVTAIDEIIVASDGVMVARGDLGVEIGDAELPAVQKHIIQRARSLNRPVITATQMMESMIHNAIPTRAEVSDVANAVLDGTDAVMLSAETAVGEHPIKVISAVSRICLSAEKQPKTQVSGHRLECQFERIDEAIAMAAMYITNHLKIKAIISITESGATPLWMSRIRSGIPVFGLSPHQISRGKMTLYRGVYPINFDVHKINPLEVNQKAIESLQKQGYLEIGDSVIVTAGDKIGIHGGTNVMKILKVGEI